MSESIKVRATQPGFHGRYREADEEFEIESEQAFSKVWMVRVEEPAPVTAPVPVEPEADAEAADTEKKSGKKGK